MTDAGKQRYYEKGKLLQKIDKLSLPAIIALNRLIESGDYNCAVAACLADCDDGILSEVVDVLNKFDIDTIEVENFYLYR